MTSYSRSFMTCTLAIFIAVSVGCERKSQQDTRGTDTRKTTVSDYKTDGMTRAKDDAAQAKQPSSRHAVSSVIHTEFKQVGYFKSKRMRGFTFFVTNPNKQDIEAFCQKKKSAFPSGRVLKIHFFDDQANTPDVTLKYYFPESSDAYLVADYFFNPFNGRQGLKVHKDIPGQPKKREL